ncbi:hypothetical protein BFP70_17435 [Thioclava sp. SK-1]|nr:hypothetical protein BFP70_17435 [Thioclava sp. SK-1]
MYIRLEKINHLRRQRRYYTLRVERTLFGDWSVTREWGRIGNPGKEQMAIFDTQAAAEAEFQTLKALKTRRGYSPIPIQLMLF